MAIANTLNLLFNRYKSSMAILSTILVYLDFSVYINIVNPNIEPKYIYFLYFAMAIPIMLSHTRYLLYFFVTNFGLLISTMLIINSLHYISIDDPALSEAIFYHIQVIIIALVLFFVISCDINAFFFSLKLLVFIVPVTIILDFGFPGLFYEHSDDVGVIGRGAATLLNPTKAGEVILLLLLLNVPLLSKNQLLGAMILGGVAVFLTFSRAAIVAWVVFYAWFTFFRWLPARFLLPLLLSLLISLSALLTAFKSYLENSEKLAPAMQDIQERLDFFSEAKTDDHSSADRLSLVQEGFNIFLQNPFTGQGAASTTYSALYRSSHNQIVLFASEYGLFGILIWLWLIRVLYCGRYGGINNYQILVTGTFVYFSFFTHNMFDFLYWLVSIGIFSSTINFYEHSLSSKLA